MELLEKTLIKDRKNTPLTTSAHWSGYKSGSPGYLMPFVEAQDFVGPNTLTKKQWRRWRLLMLPMMLFVAGPALLIGGLGLLIPLSIGYFVERNISPESVNRKPFHVKAWNWFKSFARWCARFWSEGPTIDGNWNTPRPAPKSSGGKTLPCSVCGTPVQIPAKFGRAKTAKCSNCQ